MLLVGLGDGHLISLSLDPLTTALSLAKRMQLGTKPVTLRRFHVGARLNVFAASDRPSVIYSVKKKLLYSAVNTDEVLFMTAFHCPGYPNCLALAKAGALVIGNIDEIQKLHVRSVALHEQPRRIAFHEPSGTLAVATLEYRPAREDAGERQLAWLRLLSASGLDILDSFQLDDKEEPAALAVVQLEDGGVGVGRVKLEDEGVGVGGVKLEDEGVGGVFARPPPPLAPPPASLIALGTAYVLPEQDEPTKGRILLFEVKVRGVH